MLQVTCLGGLPTQLKSLLFMVQLKLPCVVKQAVMEQVCHLPTPISSPVQTVMGSPAGPFQSLSSHGPFSVAANSSGASYQQSVQSDPQGMGGGIVMGRASGTAPGHHHASPAHYTACLAAYSLALLTHSCMIANFIIASCKSISRCPHGSCWFTNKQCCLTNLSWQLHRRFGCPSPCAYLAHHQSRSICICCDCHLHHHCHYQYHYHCHYHYHYHYHYHCHYHYCYQSCW